MTTHCPACAAPQRPGAAFCGQCGTPQPVAPPSPAAVRRPVSPALVTIAVVAVLLVAAGATAWFLLSGNGRTAAAAAPTPIAQPSGGVAPTESAWPTSTGSQASTHTAQQALASWAESDRPSAESLIGWWVPQISAKADGLVVGSTVYTDDMILAEYLAAQRAHHAVLIRSDDYTSYQRPGFWVTLVPQAYSTAAEANAWCDAQGFAADDCFAKKLSHTTGPAGTDVHR